MKKVVDLLFDNADEKYRLFQAALMPTVDKDFIIGVRVPVLRTIAKNFDTLFSPSEKQDFLSELPHKYYEENMLHAMLVSSEKDFCVAMDKTNAFLPYVDNWAVCDTFSPKAFAKNKAALWGEIERWLKSEKPYIVRYGIVNAMRHFLDEDYSVDKMEKVLDVKGGEYYVDMALAWYMSVALVKQWDDAIKVIEQKRLGVWVHNKSIQKAVESFRISDDKKNYLKSLRIQKQVLK